MISGISMSALRILVYLAQQDRHGVNPRRISEEMGESPTDLSRVTTLLLEAGVLRAEEDVVRLSRAPIEISVLDVVEACQGPVVGDYCGSICLPSEICAFHQMAEQLHIVICETLRRWTLEELRRKPSGEHPSGAGSACLMLPLQSGTTRA